MFSFLPVLFQLSDRELFIKKLYGYSIIGAPKKPLLFGERTNRHTRSRHTNRICLPSSASDDEHGSCLPNQRFGQLLTISVESLIIQHTMMYHTTKPVCWQDKQDNKIIVSISAGSSSRDRSHTTNPFYTIHSLPLVKGGAEVRDGGIA